MNQLDILGYHIIPPVYKTNQKKMSTVMFSWAVQFQNIEGSNSCKQIFKELEVFLEIILIIDDLVRNIIVFTTFRHFTQYLYIIIVQSPKLHHSPIQCKRGAQYQWQGSTGSGSIKLTGPLSEEDKACSYVNI